MRSLIVSLSLFALATAASAAPLVTPGEVGERRWSLGAGLHLRGGSIVGFQASDLMVPGVSIERWFGRRFSIGLNLEGRANLVIIPHLQRQSAPFAGWAVGLGARYTLTDVGAPVSLSVFATLMLSTAALRPMELFVNASQNTDAASLTGGLALERWLHPRVSARLLIGVLRSGVTRTSFFIDGDPKGPSGLQTSLDGRLDLLPSLELRWFF